LSARPGSSAWRSTAPASGERHQPLLLGAIAQVVVNNAPHGPLVVLDERNQLALGRPAAPLALERLDRTLDVGPRLLVAFVALRQAVSTGVDLRGASEKHDVPARITQTGVRMDDRRSAALCENVGLDWG
jgi:hypothetical protein